MKLSELIYQLEKHKEKLGGDVCVEIDFWDVNSEVLHGEIEDVTCYRYGDRSESVIIEITDDRHKTSPIGEDV